MRILAVGLAPFLLVAGGGYVGTWSPAAGAQGQDSPQLARALDRAERFDAAMGPHPQPTARWLEGDRLAYSPVGKAPWTVFEAATGRVLESGIGDAAVGGAGQPAVPTLPSWMAPTERTDPAWMVRTENTDLVVADAAGVTRLRLPGAPRYGWSTPPQGGNRDRRIFVALRVDQRAVHTLPIVDYTTPIERVTFANYRADGTRITQLGQASTAPLEAVGYTPPEPFRVKAADGTTDIYGVLYRPTDFDASRRYPIVDYIYAGPFVAGHQTTYAPTTAMHRIAASLAQMGFVVAMLDARGTPGRGKAFQDANYGRIGQVVEIPDHVAALRALARTRPYIDTTRAGIVGHSWGGYFALRGMVTAPDFFTVGYAGAPGDLTEAASINEPNMGLLADNAIGYESGSNLKHASALRGRLKIMHGTSDVMAPLSTTMRMVQALIEADKTFDLLIMPGQPHGPQGAAGRYYREDVRRFMATHLLRDDTSGR